MSGLVVISKIFGFSNNVFFLSCSANEDQTEFSCQFCDKSYKFKGDLTRHIILKHTEDDFENSEEKDVDPIGTNAGSNAEEKPGANQGTFYNYFEWHLKL